jgi:hypothetical protein
MAVNFTYTGTAGGSIVKIDQLRRLVDEVDLLVRTAARQQDANLMKDWFGKNFEGSRAAGSKLAVLNGIAALQTYITNNTLAFTSKDVNSFGFADQSTIVPAISLGKWFGFKWFTWADRIVTLVHELSHKCTMLTKDEPLKGEPAYKYKSVQLSQDPSVYAKALTNAENWGYFIASHYRLAGLAANRTDDWVYLAKSKLDMRGQPSETQKDKMTNDPAIMVAGAWKTESGQQVANGPKLDCATVVESPQRRIYEYLANAGQAVVEKILI